MQQRPRKGGRADRLQRNPWHRNVDRVLEVDQTPIGKTPRSCPATYIGFWDDIRRVFEGTTEARIRVTLEPLLVQHRRWRCDACEGQGVKTIEMNFLPDVKVLCDVCGGRRFNSETLSVLWREKSIGDILSMSIDDAVEFFQAHPKIHHCLSCSRTWDWLPDSGSTEPNAVRWRGATHQARRRAFEGAQRCACRSTAEAQAHAVCPRRADGRLAHGGCRKLIHVLHRLVGAGNTAVVVEHNLDVMAEADWIVDMGPEAGEGGGEIVAQGPPAQIARRKKESHTGRVAG